jgi:hypothetical protein
MRMNIFKKGRWAAFLLIVLMGAGCNVETGDTTANTGTTKAVTGSGDITEIQADSDADYVKYTQDLGTTPQDVYLIFTNKTSSGVSVSSISSSMATVSDSDLGRLSSVTEEMDPEDWAKEHGILQRGKPEITEYNNNPPTFDTQQTVSSSELIETEPLLSSVNDTYDFKYDSTTSISATCRSVTTDGTITLNIWVADDAWDSCSKSYCMTQTMVDAFATKFLQSGTSNDIYDWVTGIYGLPWGSHSSSYYIDSSAASSIDILFYDIDNDDTSGSTAGFFWSKDNILSSYNSYSNERLMFYMDSVLSAYPDGTTWEITDSLPADMASTLAHEFQHMIHFYQKAVTYGSSSETWINEMASMMAEDLVADKLEVNGPRGVSYSDDSAGSAGTTGGRLPLFNVKNYYSPTQWNSDLTSYSVVYAFGAYLGRNYGGAELFRNVVQRANTDYTAITESIEDLGYSSITLSTLLKQWGIAVLMSDQTDTDAGYQYNTGSAFSAALDGITYNLGSINMFNYDYGTQSGPKLYTASSLSDLGTFKSLSNTYVQVGSGETGTFTATIEMHSGVDVTVVVKETD